MKYLFVVWSDDYKTGIGILDEQFRGVTSIINFFFFHRADVTGDIDRVLAPTMEMFKSYVKINFVTIEKMMAGSDFSGREEYEQIHKKILVNITIFEQACRAERDADKRLNYLKVYWPGSVKNNSTHYNQYLAERFGEDHITSYADLSFDKR